MLNCIQIVVRVPMYEKLKFPASAMDVTESFVKIAKFDVISTDRIDEKLWIFPEDKAFSPGFETSGVESQLLLQNIGPTIYIFCLNILVGVLHFILMPCAYLCACCKKVTNRIGNYLYF